MNEGENLGGARGLPSSAAAGLAAGCPEHWLVFQALCLPRALKGASFLMTCLCPY